MTDDPTIKPPSDPHPNHAVQVLFAGSQLLGLFAEEIEAISDWRQPAPLPEAPAGVLGVVSIRGRMLTVLDAAALVGQNAGTDESVGTRNSKLETRNLLSGKIVRLRGDEQLALAVAGVGEVIEIAPDEMKPASDSSQPYPLILGVVSRGEQSIVILDHNRLFSTVMRGRERRQRHF